VSTVAGNFGFGSDGKDRTAVVLNDGERAVHWTSSNSLTNLDPLAVSLVFVTDYVRNVD
jgi:hypothetical protein